jgi:hypothetical protein
MLLAVTFFPYPDRSLFVFTNRFQFNLRQLSFGDPTAFEYFWLVLISHRFIACLSLLSLRSFFAGSGMGTTDRFQGVPWLQNRGILVRIDRFKLMLPCYVFHGE